MSSVYHCLSVTMFWTAVGGGAGTVIWYLLYSFLLSCVILWSCCAVDRSLIACLLRLINLQNVTMCEACSCGLIDFFLLSLYGVMCLAAALRIASLSWFQCVSISSLVAGIVCRCGCKLASMSWLNFSHCCSEFFDQLYRRFGILTLGACMLFRRGHAANVQIAILWSVDNKLGSIVMMFACVRDQKGDWLIQIWSILLW